MTHDDLLEPFLEEARELLGRATQDLGRLGQAPRDRGALDGFFRTVHTLKGSTALLDLSPLTRLFHAAETRLEAARADGVLTDVETMARSVDAFEAWLEALEGGVEPPAALMARVAQLTADLDASDGAPALASGAAEPAAAWATALAASVPGDGARVVVRYVPAPDAYFRGEDPLALMSALPGLQRLVAASEAAGDPAAYDPYRCALRFEAVSDAPLASVRAALRLVADDAVVVAVDPGRDAPEPGAAPAPALQLRGLTVEAARLDALAALVDEMVVAKNGLAHEVRRLLAATAGADVGRDLLNREAALDRLVADLHAAVTGLRLTPLAALFGRFPRLAREIAERLGKSVDLRTDGEGASLDKAVVEGLFEPLLHLVRNSLDHGLEDPGTRRAAGKPERGVLAITARSDGAHVVLEVADDGRGLDPAALRAAAVSRGVLDAASAAALSDAAAAELVFAAGFSTAAKVSELSGRGVGMDAVRTAVTRLGGVIGLENRPRAGLTVRLTLPARVRLQRVLTVWAGGERFAAPLDAIVETHRVRRSELTAIRDGQAYVRRDRVIPILRLDARLGLSPSPEMAEAFPVLSLQVGGERVGLRVDAVGERLEAPMRSMSGLMTDYPGVLGTIVEGDGRVLLVLDLEALAA